MLVVRHASAGKRDAWEGDDRLRPLDQRGLRQARGLVEALAHYPVERIVSSPYVRCLQTVKPLADARGLVIEPRAELDDTASPEAALPLLRQLPAHGVVACVHGSLREALGLERFPKGSAVVLDAELHVDHAIRPAA